MTEQLQKGMHELRAARAESRGLYWAVGIFSFFANLLMLTGPIQGCATPGRIVKGAGGLIELCLFKQLVACDIRALPGAAVAGWGDHQQGQKSQNFIRLRPSLLSNIMIPHQVGKK